MSIIARTRTLMYNLVDFIIRLICLGVYTIWLDTIGRKSMFALADLGVVEGGDHVCNRSYV